MLIGESACSDADEPHWLSGRSEQANTRRLMYTLFDEPNPSDETIRAYTAAYQQNLLRAILNKERFQTPVCRRNLQRVSEQTDDAYWYVSILLSNPYQPKGTLFRGHEISLARLCTVPDGRSGLYSVGEQPPGAKLMEFARSDLAGAMLHRDWAAADAICDDGLIIIYSYHMMKYIIILLLLMKYHLK